MVKDRRRREPHLSVDEIVAVLDVRAPDRPLGPGVPVTQLDHALQTAAVLRHDHPDDVELAVAGLVHDLGQLLPGARDETHAADAAAAVRGTLGERVAGIVALHVEAKRYLVATEADYGGALTDDSVVSLGRQGGILERARRRRSWRCPGRPMPSPCAGPTTAPRSSASRLRASTSGYLFSVGCDGRPASGALEYCRPRPSGCSGQHPAGGVQRE